MVYVYLRTDAGTHMYARTRTLHWVEAVTVRCWQWAAVTASNDICVPAVTAGSEIHHC